jgi:hypothetical protein
MCGNLSWWNVRTDPRTAVLLGYLESSRDDTFRLLPPIKDAAEFSRPPNDLRTDNGKGVQVDDRRIEVVT